MQHLFSSWDSFLSDIRTASHTILLSDYDGTLTPIVSRPDEAILSPEVREMLTNLAKKPSLSIGIISGRSLSEIKKMVEIDGIYYAGNHGLEIEGPGINFVNPSALAARNEIRELARQLSDELGKIEGVIVEDKELSLSVHYRMVKTGDETVVAGIFHQITSPLLNEGKIKVTAGKKVWEARPPIDWHKGKTAEIIIQKIKGILNYQQLITVYLGDDKTDEDVFKIIQRPQGWSIFIGGDNPSSSADYYLDSPAEVKTFLSRTLNLYDC